MMKCQKPIKLDLQLSRKETYEPPSASFIPIKLDERIMACDQEGSACNMIRRG